MQRAKTDDGPNPLKIIVIYASEGLPSSFFAFERGAIINLDELEQEEEQGPYFRGENSIDAKLIRSQFDANYKWIGSINKYTPDIFEDCKYILIRKVSDADIGLDSEALQAANILQANIDTNNRANAFGDAVDRLGTDLQRIQC
ncbi:hypothetical protein GGI08_005494, partial [Coemansia sp. S2]